MSLQQTLTKEQAQEKIRQYCAYQERYPKKVREKLLIYGLTNTDVEIVLGQLIEENYVSEERYAIQYAGGKFRMNQWGKNKIIHALREKQVNDSCIKKALQEIDIVDYQKVIARLAAKKWTSLKADAQTSRQMKTRNYLLQKGFEAELINRALQLLPAR